jgi:homoserine kinase
MTPRSVKVYAPASISNLGPGFDVLGIAIDKPGDYVVAKRKSEKGLTFSLRTDQEGIPSDAGQNVASFVASLILDEMKPGFGVSMVLHKQMPLGSGLGSSAASSAAAAVAVNALLPKPLKKYALLRFVVEGERKAAGSPHADNAAPSLLGGAWLIRSYNPLDAISIPVQNRIIWVVVHPHVIVHTREARGILPKEVPLSSAIRQWGNVSGLTAGLIAGDPWLVGKCVEDVIVEPVRSRLIPGFAKVKEAALKSGALGCSISGSGPSMFAVTSSTSIAQKVSKEMIKAFRRYASVGCEAYISRVNGEGARVVWTKPE